MKKGPNFALSAEKGWNSNALNVARHYRFWQSFVLNAAKG
jgi:hypothetical protein